MGRELPTGTISFLFTDIEESTKLAQRFGADFPQLIADHFAIIRAAVSAGGGVEVKTTGDGVFAAFPRASGAMSTADEIQHRMFAREWPEGGDVRIRIGVHSGEAIVADDDYVGLEVHRAARIMAAGHGGQVLVSETARLLAGAGFEYRSLGEHLLRGLEEEVAVHQLIIRDLPSDFPPLNTASAIPNNLPTRVSSIIGRDDDIEAVTGLMDAHRLLTILGPGGVGKTSLAVTAGSRVVDRFPGGVTFVDLSAVSDAAFVVSSVAKELGVEPKTVEGVSRGLGEKQALLLLDNFEQVTDAAQDVARLMEAGPNLRFLVTSQVPLRLPGEQRYVLGTLGVDGSGDSAGIELFLERARAADPSFSADREEVAALVGRLDGLPLAIELVAARANVLSPAEMLERLEQGQMTYSATVGSPDRHRSLDDALQWSYGLLDEQSQRVFRRLSVFAGDMSLATAEAVVQDAEVPDALVAIGELVDRSLLLRETGSSSRYHMLDGIRRHGRRLLDQTDEAQEIRDRLVAHYRSLGDEAYLGLQSDRGEWWRAHLADELDNLREVLSFLHSEGSGSEGLELLGNTWRFYHSRGHLSEFDLWLERFFAIRGSDNDGHGFVKGLMARAAVRYWQEKPDLAVADYEEAVARARGLGDKPILADALYGLATSLMVARREDEADPFQEEARVLYEELNDPGGIADIVAGDAFIVKNREGLSGLGPAFEEASDLYRKAGRRIQAIQGVYAQTAVALAERRLDDARELAHAGLSESVELNDVFLQTWGLEYMASIELELNDLERAGLFIGAAEAARDRIGGGWRPETIGLADAQESLVGRIGRENADKLIKPGRELDLAEAIDLALGDG